MSDTISRQAAIDTVKSRKTAEQCENGVVRNWAVDLCVDALEKLPSAQPERDIPLDCITDEGGNAICPKCGANAEWHKYCRECGQALRWKG